jgi:myo-inositol-1(or 4)-monophosphatase
MKPTVNDLVIWAKGAGAVLRDGYGKSHAIDYKGSIDLVTEMDHKSEAYLVEKIRARFPEHTIFAEETGEISGSEGACWYIDPLDGTTNYAHHMPNFAVSVAYLEDGALEIGVIYDPMRDECYSASRGKGAYLNDRTIHVSTTDNLLSSLLVTGFPYDQARSEKNLANFCHFTRLSQGVRRLGSAAIDLCYIAAGRLDGYWEMSLQPYDMAAGALIVREAGGTITSMYGNEDVFQPPYSIAAGNPTIHALLLKELQNRP